MEKTKEGTILLKYKTLAGQGFVSIDDRWAGIEGNTVPEEIGWKGFNAAETAWYYVLYAFEELQDEGLESLRQLEDRALLNVVSDFTETLRSCAVGCSMSILATVLRHKGYSLNEILGTIENSEECFKLIMQHCIWRAVRHLRRALEDVGAGDLMPE